MIYLKTDEEIELMREANQLVGKTLGEVLPPESPHFNLIRLRKSSLEIMVLFRLFWDMVVSLIQYVPQ